MLAIGFWNVDKKVSSVRHIAALLKSLEISAALSEPESDILFCVGEPGDIKGSQITDAMVEIGCNVTKWWSQPSGITKKFLCLSNIPRSTVTSLLEIEAGWPLRLVRTAVLVAPTAYHVWFVHLGSPHATWQPNVVGQHEGGRLARACQELEETTGIPDSIVIGDFNMDPYTEAMIDPRCVGAVMCRQIAERLPIRSFGPQGFPKSPYPVFYNPMWNLLGDRTDGNQPGSFYNGGDNSDAATWHAIDQALIRPGLIKSLPKGSPKILVHTGQSDLLTENGIIINDISDHLPLVISLEI